MPSEVLLFPFSFLISGLGFHLKKIGHDRTKDESFLFPSCVYAKPITWAEKAFIIETKRNPSIFYIIPYERYGSKERSEIK